MRIAAVHHPDYTIRMPASHPFPMAKFSILKHQLVHFESEFQWYLPPLASRAELETVHEAHYLDALFAGTLDRAAERRSGFPWSEALVRRVRLETGGTCLTARLALENGLALNAAGGTHHAHADFASGYCLLNDIAVATRTLLAGRVVDRVLIVDLDVHQGDGTARLLANEPRAFTFSMHAARNFPARKAVSDLDMPLESGLGDDDYLETLAGVLPRLLDEQQPSLVIYDAGVDVHSADRLGHLCLSDSGLFRRDRFVMEAARRRGIPVAAVIGGGYDRDIDALCRRHGQLFRAAVLGMKESRYNPPPTF
ncbi:histone deacetylase family protein [Spiribacter insolitus]|uniref:Histone deacetylase n=1 Tax=Spiribacter insolitus TaxID=3122417 RepID=A0ABV3T7D8_9GAMM